MINFRNDYSNIAVHEILDRLVNLENEANIGYGEDIHTNNAISLIKKEIGIGANPDIYFLAGGTVTNMIAISSFLRPHEAVIASDTGHINVHETGAIESNGHKILTVKNENGKLTPKLIKKVLDKHSDYHMVKPKLVFISNATELGTVYTKTELKDISEYCHKNDLYLYLDGARLAVALDKSDLTLYDYYRLTDAFYIGGTKIGAPLGEALLINNKKLNEDFKYLIKHFGGMLAKGFVPAISFEVLFENGLYYKLGKHENEVASFLAEGLKKIGVKFFSEPCTNQIFVILHNRVIKELEKSFAFETWEKINEEYTAIRFVVSFKSTKDDALALISSIKELL